MAPLVTMSYTPATQTLIASAGVTTDFTTLYNLVNGLLDDANIASLTETKVTFLDTGHDHSGGIKGGLVAMPKVDGRLAIVSATQIKLAPYCGNRLYVKKSGVWTATTIPSAGITANNTSTFVDGASGQNLGASTLYYVYVFDNAGTLALDFSATGHSTDATTGLEIKTAVDTRVLVGMVRTNGSSQFQFDSGLIGVLSYWNRREVAIATAFSTDRSTASGSYVELNSEIRGNFLTWGDEGVFVALNGSSVNSGANATTTAIAFDGSTGDASFAYFTVLGTADSSNAISGYKSLSEGFHFATVAAQVGAGTGTWRSSNHLHVKVRG